MVVGKIECGTCHGDVKAMTIAEQKAWQVAQLALKILAPSCAIRFELKAKSVKIAAIRTFAVVRDM